MQATPLSDEKGDEFKKEVLIALHEVLLGLKNINKDEVTKEDIEDAMAEKK